LPETRALPPTDEPLRKRSSYPEDIEMNGLRIADLAEGGHLAFDLKEILAAIGPAVSTSRWLCTDLWCIPFGEPDDQALEACYRTGSFIGGEELVELAAQTRQVVDGTFRAFRESAEQPWLILRAVDSSFWEVFSDDAATLDKLRVRFQDVRDITSDAA
jgi:hypothetical protein